MADRAIGLMRGTSLDGIDIALIETDGERRDRARADSRRSTTRPRRGRCCGALWRMPSLSTDRRERPGRARRGGAAC